MADAAPTPVTHRARYGATLAFVLALVVWLLAGAEYHDLLFLVVLVGLGCAVILSALWMTRMQQRRPIEGLVVLSIVVALATLLGLVDERVLKLVATLIVLAVALVVPVLVVQGLLRRGVVDVQLVLGVLTIYLLFGIASAMVIGLIAQFESKPILVAAEGATDGTFRDRAYFAFTTLTTTGYGDITPGTDAARAAAMLTALVGQLYLVTAVAASVSLVAGDRARAHAKDGA